MVNHHLVIALYRDVVALVCAASLAISAPAATKITEPLKLTSSINAMIDNYPNESDAYMKAMLWPYLRKGINYLEASGKEVPTYFMHSGSKAYGPLALTPVAIKDVKKHYPGLSNIRMEDVLLDKNLYEAFAVLYADLLLKHYLKLDYVNMDKKEVFDILQKAWFLGPTLYLKGRPVIASREIKAKKYIAS